MSEPTIEFLISKSVGIAEHTASPFFSMGRCIVPPWCPTDKAPAIFEAMGKVMKGIDAIGKDRKNEQQKYRFRGIDDVYNALHSLLAENGVITNPVVLDRAERATTSSKSGSAQVSVTERVEYWCTSCVDGSVLILGPVWSEALDNSDKATNKCMSFAQKYALLQAFTIPTEDVAEGDRETVQRAPRDDKHQEKQREPGDDTATDVISTDTAKQVYRQFGELGVTKEMLDAKIGYGVDGLEVGWLETLRGWRDECKNTVGVTRLFGAKTENKTP
jgi:hypothetical protein